MADRTLFPRERPSAALERSTPMGYANRPALSSFNTPFGSVGEQTPFYTVDPNDVGGGGAGAGGFADLSNLGEATPLGLSGMGAFSPAGTKGRGTILKIGATELAQSMVSMAETMFPEIQGLGEWRRDLDQTIENQIASLRPELQKQLEMEFLSLDKDDSVLRNPSALISHFMRQIPNLAFTLVPAGGAASVAGRTVAKRAGAAAGQRAATIAGGAAGGAAVLPMIGGYTAGEISTGIEQAPVEVLRESPRFQQLEEQLGEAGARETLKRELRGPAALEAGGISAIFGVVGGAFFGRLFGTARPVRPDNARMFQQGTRSRSALEQFGAQGLTEAPQEGYETFVANRAAQDSFDPGRGTFENIGEAATAGGVIGGLTGGLLGGALGGGRRRKGAPSTAVDPGVQQALSMDRATQQTFPGMEIGEASALPQERPIPDRVEFIVTPEMQREFTPAQIEQMRREHQAQQARTDAPNFQSDIKQQRMQTGFGNELQPPGPLALPPPTAMGQAPIAMGSDTGPGPGATSIVERGGAPFTDPRVPGLPLAEPIGGPEVTSPPRRTAPRRDPEQAELPLEATTLPSNQAAVDPVQAALFDTMLAEADTPTELRSTLSGMTRAQIAGLLETREPVTRRMTKSAMIDHIVTRYGDQVGENFRARLDQGRQRQLDLRTTEQRRDEFVARPDREGETRPDVVEAQERLSSAERLNLSKARQKAAKANQRRISRRGGTVDAKTSRGIRDRVRRAFNPTKEDSALGQDIEARRLVQEYATTLLNTVRNIDSKQITGAEKADAARQIQDLIRRVSEYVKTGQGDGNALSRDILRGTLLTEQMLKDAGQPRDMFRKFDGVRGETALLQTMAEITDDLRGVKTRERRRPSSIERTVTSLTESDLEGKAPAGGWAAALNDMMTTVGLPRTVTDAEGKKKQLNNAEKLRALQDHFDAETNARAGDSAIERFEGVAARIKERSERPAQDKAAIKAADRTRKRDEAKRAEEKAKQAAITDKALATKKKQADEEERRSFLKKFLREGATQERFLAEFGESLNAEGLRKFATDLGINLGRIRGRKAINLRIFRSDYVQNLIAERTIEREAAQARTKAELDARAAEQAELEAKASERLDAVKSQRNKIIAQMKRLKVSAFGNSHAFEFLTAVENVLDTMKRGFDTGQIRVSRDSQDTTEFTAERAENLLKRVEEQVDLYLRRVADGYFESRSAEASGTSELASAINEEINRVRTQQTTQQRGQTQVEGVSSLPKTFKNIGELAASARQNLGLFTKWVTYVRENNLDTLSRSSTIQARIVGQSLESVAAASRLDLDPEVAALVAEQQVDDTTSIEPEIIGDLDERGLGNDFQQQAIDELPGDAGVTVTDENQLILDVFGDDLATPDQTRAFADVDAFAQPRILERLRNDLGRLVQNIERHTLISNYRDATEAYNRNRNETNKKRQRSTQAAITEYNQNRDKSPHFRMLRLNADNTKGLARDPRLNLDNAYDAKGIGQALENDYRNLMRRIEDYAPGQVTRTVMERNPETGRMRKVSKQTTSEPLRMRKAAQERKRALSQKQALAKIGQKLDEGKQLTKGEMMVLANADTTTAFDALTSRQRELIRDQVTRNNRKLTKKMQDEVLARAAEALGPENQDVADAIRATGKVKRSRKGVNFMPAAIAKYSEGYRNAGRQLFAAIENMPNEGMNLNDLLRAMEGSGNALVNMLTSALQRLNLNVKVAMALDTDLGQLGEYNPDTRTITLNPDLLRSLREETGSANAEGTLAHVFLHEVVHAATVHGLTTNRRIARQMESLRKQAFLMLSRKYSPNELPYGLRNVNEFVAEAFTNPDFQADLRSIEWGRPGRVEQMWTAFRNMVRTVINRLSGGRFAYDQVQAQENAFDSIMAARDDLFMTDAQVTEAIRTNPERISNDPILFAEQFTSGFKMAAEKTRNISTGFMTRQQLTDWYGKFFDGAMEKWNELNAKREAWMRRYQATANDISVEWSRLRSMDPAADQALSDMLIESRNIEVAPQHTIDHKLNKHLQNNPVLERRYYKARQQYEALHPDARALYDKLTNYFNEDWNATQNKLINNVLDAYGVEIDYRGGELDLDAMRTIRDEELSEAQKKSIRALITRRRQNRGNYFPSMRFGDHVVVSMMESQIEGETRKQVEDQVKAWKLEGPTNEFSEVELGADGVWRASVKSKEVEFFESSSEAEAARNRKLADPNYFDVEPKALKQSLFSGDRAVPGWEFMGALESAFAKKPEMLNTVREVYLQLLPETSMRKHEMRRSKRKGASLDTHRTFRAYAMKASYHRAQLEFGRQIGEAVQGMRDVEAKNKSDDNRFLRGQILKELAARDAKGHNAVRSMPVISKVTDLGFIWYLLSPSYWMVNATQPIALGLPFLSARYGAVASARAMKNAYGDVMGDVFQAMVDSKLGLEALRSYKTQEEFFDANDLVKKFREKGQNGVADMLQEVAERGLIDVGGFAASLRENASTSVSNFETKWTKVVEMARTMPHIVEVMNRSVIGIAAYNLEMAQNTEGDPALRQQKAVDAALKAIRDTQFDYSGGNKARFMSSNTFALAGPLFLFKQYMQHIYFTFAKGALDIAGNDPVARRTAAKQLMFIFGTHAAFAGVLGAMFEPIKWAMGLVWALGFQDKDDPVSFDVAFRQTMSEYLGPQIGEAVSRGLPRLAGVDVSTRIGLNNLIFFDRGMGPADRNAFANTVVAALGPVAAMGERATRAVGDFQNGNTLRAMENATPKLFRDWIRAYRLNTEGMLDYRGNLIVDSNSIGPGQLFLQSLGITPAQMAEVGEARRVIQGSDGLRRERRQRLMQQYYRAEPAKRTQLMQREIRRFNEVNPDSKISRSDLLQGLRQRRRFEQQQMEDLAVVRGSARDRLVARARFANTRTE